MWMALGNPAQAASTYQQVIDRAGNRIYAQTARLGLAEAQAAQGQYDQAINTFKELAQRKDGQLPPADPACELPALDAAHGLDRRAYIQTQPAPALEPSTLKL